MSRRIAISVDDDILEALNAHTRGSPLSRSELVNVALRRFLRAERRVARLHVNGAEQARGIASGIGAIAPPRRPSAPHAPRPLGELTAAFGARGAPGTVQRAPTRRRIAHLRLPLPVVSARVRDPAADERPAAGGVPGLRWRRARGCSTRRASSSRAAASTRPTAAPHRRRRRRPADAPTRQAGIRCHVRDPPSRRRRPSDTPARRPAPKTAAHRPSPGRRRPTDPAQTAPLPE